MNLLTFYILYTVIYDVKNLFNPIKIYCTSGVSVWISPKFKRLVREKISFYKKIKKSGIRKDFLNYVKDIVKNLKRLFGVL